MDFIASPLGQLHQTFKDEYQEKCKPDESLDDWELRVYLQDPKYLRPKTRATHRVNAFPVVHKAFLKSVDSLVRDQKNLDASAKAGISAKASSSWQAYAVPRSALKLSDLPRLYDRAVQLVKDNQLMNVKTQPIIESDFLTLQSGAKPPTRPSSSSSSSSSTLASSSSSLAGSLSSSAAVSSQVPAPTASSLASFSSSASLSSSAAVSSQLAAPTVSSSASASPVAIASAQLPAVLAVLKADYPAEKFLAEQGPNDAASLQMRRQFFHAKLDALVQIAVGCKPMLLGPDAADDGYGVLKRAAERMKREPYLQPAVALYLETIDAALDRIEAYYQAQAQECPQSAEHGK